MRVRWFFICAVVLLGLTEPASAGAAEKGPSVATAVEVNEAQSGPRFGSDSGWQFSVEPYLWMSSLKGDMGIVPQVAPVGVDLSFGDILSHLKLALMGTFDARHGRFVASGDLLFLR